MPFQVVTGALLQCSFGAAPCTLNVLPVNKLLVTMPAANILDHKPLVNIPTFGVCYSLANPLVAAATAAAFGVLTPMPCIPATAAPWFPGSPKLIINGMPALIDTSKCSCAYGGIIQIIYSGEVKMKAS